MKSSAIHLNQKSKMPEAQSNITHAESFPLLFNQRYKAERSESTVTSLTQRSYTPFQHKSEAELKKMKIVQFIFLTILIGSAFFLLFFPITYNHYRNADKIRRANILNNRKLLLEKLKCDCNTKNHTSYENSVHLVIESSMTSYRVPMALQGETCSPELRSDVSTCFNQTCEYSPALGTIATVFEDIREELLFSRIFARNKTK